MTDRNKNNRKPKPSRSRKRRLARKQASSLSFERLEPKNLLAAISVGNATDVSNAPDTSSITALMANDGGDGISLREAIAAANNTTGEDTITFNASVFSGGANNLIRLTQGELSISDGLTIDGSSVGGVVITGDANGDDITLAGTYITDVSASSSGTAGGADDLLDDNSQVLFFPSPFDLALTDLTITGGRSTGIGGGIRTNVGNISLTSSTVSGNSSGDNGGGIFTNSGNVSLTDSTVSGNIAMGFNTDGGGIRTSEGNVFLTNSTFSGNSSGDDGGAIFTTYGDVSLVDSTVRENSSGNDGGGIATFGGNVSVTNSTVSGNSTTRTSSKGGGIKTSGGNVSLYYGTVMGNSTTGGSSVGGGISTGVGSVSLINSTVSNNSTVSSSNFGSSYNAKGGGIFTDSDSVSLTNSTVSGNSSDGDGGGIFASSDAASVSLINSTVSGNTSSLQGGGISSRSGDLSLNNSTVNNNSSGSSGGGIYAPFGSASLTSSVVSDNNSGGNAGGIGAGSLTLTNSTVSGNSSVNSAGGISGFTLSSTNSTVSGNSTGGSGGGIRADNVFLTNSTVSGNSSGGDGGGIFSTVFTSTVLVVNSTVTGNSAAGEGGGIVFQDPDRGVLTLQNAIVAGNTDNGTAPDVASISNLNDLVVEHSLIGDTTGSVITTTTGTGNVLNQTALLGPLVDNGGPTLTHALLPGSPAIDAGDDALAVDDGGPLASDQRGNLFDRSFDDPTAVGTGVDIGAFELHALLVDNPIDEDDGIVAVGDLSLREAIGLANDNPAIDTISFDSSVFTGGDNNVIRLTEGELSISDRLTIDGSLIGGLVITGDANDDDVTVSGANITDVSASFGGTVGASDDLLDDNSRVLNFSGSGNLSLRSLTITGGRTTSNFASGGGIIASDGNLFLTNSMVSGNSTQGSSAAGGGIFSAIGDVAFTASTVSGNSAGDNGGGIFTGTGDLSFINSTVSGNISGGDGGGIGSDDSTVSLVNSTVTGNSASNVGGGLALNADAPNVEGLTLHNSIVAGNTDNGDAPDLSTPSDLISNLIVEHSLIGDTTGSGITSTTGVGNILNQSASLGPLADNGGPTLTHTLLEDSPARNAGSDALAVDENGNALTTDQLGDERIQFGPIGTVDIGAVESKFAEDMSLVVTISQDVDDAFDGFISLREAIAFANDPTAGVNNDGDADDDGSVADTIIFDDGVFTGGDDNLIRLTLGELSISESLTIDAGLVGGVVVTGDANDDDVTLPETDITDVSASFGGTAGASDDLLDDNSRVLNFSGSGLGGSGNLILTDLTITGGRAADDSEDGGGIRLGTLSSLALNQSEVSGNVATGRGGGIFSSSGDVLLNSSTVSGNRSVGEGGGIRTYGGDVSLMDSEVSGNTTTGVLGSGGGISVRSGEVSLTSSTVSANISGRDGGGIRSFNGAVLLTNSTVDGNSSENDGGGISNFNGDVSLTNSTVSGNVSDGEGGGISNFNGDVLLADSAVSANVSNGRGGGISNANSDVFLVNSTVSGNVSNGNGGGIFAANGDLVSLNASTISGNSAINGGGIGVFSADVSLTNSTVSGNSSAGDGGAIWFDSSAVLLVNSTVTSNSAAGVGGGISFAFTNNIDGETLTIHNSIVAGNTDSGLAPDVLAIGDVTNNLSVEHSLIGDTNGSGITATTGAGNILDQLAMLGPLADNGGPTMTHALLSGSPAIDAGDDALAVDANGGISALATDQRGGNSIRSFDDPAAIGTGVDIGAFELHAVLVDNPIDEDDGNTAVGDLSLREAIRLANDNSLLDAVAFDTTVFTGGGSNLIRLTQGELSISDSLIIDGNSVGGLVITGDANGDDVTVNGTDITDVSASFGESAGDVDDLLDDNSRVIGFTSEEGNLTLTGLTITGGRTTENNAFISGQGFETIQSGGGIRFDSNGSLTLSVTLSGNSTSGRRSRGGGIYSTGGDVSLFNSTVADNSLTGDSSDGGGIASFRGDVSLANSTVSGNSAVNEQFSNNGGGGIYTVFGNVKLFSSNVSGNISDLNGGGISAFSGDVSLSNSAVSENISDEGGGGGISAATVTVTNSTVSGNSSGGDGGGIRGGTVFLTNSSVNDNSSVDDGGGIFTSSGDVSLIDSTLTGNSSTYGTGGGISSTRGDVFLSNSTVSENSATSFRSGGGIYAGSGNVSLIDSILSENSTLLDGGGIFTNDGNITLTNSTVSDNSAGFDGGGISTSAGDITSVNSTVSGNTADRRGGGIYVTSSIVDLTNSTLSGNTASEMGGGIFILANNSFSSSGPTTVSLVNSSIVGNSSDTGGGISLTPVFSGGFSAPVSFTIANSIVADNIDNAGTPDLNADSDFVNSLVVEHSLIGNTNGSNISATTGTGNILNQSALLGPLADNGGPTQTHALLPGSPAIDAGNDALAVDENGVPLVADQIGQNRLFDGNDDGTATVDIGAVEFQGIRTAGQFIFYNNSGFDGTSNADAIATDKVALRDGETASFENYTSYVNGINGIAVDLFNPGTLVASDFGLRFGNSDDVTTFATLDASSTIVNLTTVAGVGVNGSDRVFIEFADGAITNGWLQVTVVANAATGLTEDDVFYFGNAIGESGNVSDNATVNLSDVSGARTNQTGFGLTDLFNVFDFNRDARVNLADVSIARTNQSGFTPIRLITPTDSSAGSSNKSRPSARSTATAGVVQPISVSTTVAATSEAATANFASFAVAPTIPTAIVEKPELKEAPQRSRLALVEGNLDTRTPQQDALDRVFETTTQDVDLTDSIQLTDIDSLFETNFSADL